MGMANDDMVCLVRKIPDRFGHCQKATTSRLPRDDIDAEVACRPGNRGQCDKFNEGPTECWLILSPASDKIARAAH